MSALTELAGLRPGDGDSWLEVSKKVPSIAVCVYCPHDCVNDKYLLQWAIEVKQCVIVAQQCVGLELQCIGVVPRCIWVVPQCIAVVPQCVGIALQCIGAAKQDLIAVRF